MKVSLKVAFSILDGRLSTKIEDVYEMLNYIFDQRFMTHQLPSAMQELKKSNPEWFKKAVKLIDDIKRVNRTNDFEELMCFMDEEFFDYTVKLEKLDAKIDFLAGII